MVYDMMWYVITVRIIIGSVHILGIAFPYRRPSTFHTGTLSKLTNSTVPEAISSERLPSNEISNGPCEF